MKLKLTIVFFLTLFWMVPLVSAQEEVGAAPVAVVPSIPPPAPATGLTVQDTDNDNGHSVTLHWSLSPDDGAGAASVLGYKIFRSESREGPFVERGVAPSTSTDFIDAGAADETSGAYYPSETDFYYKLRIITLDSTVFSETEAVGPVRATGQWFNTARTAVLIFVIFFMILMIYFINQAKKGVHLFVRKLAGIEAVDEAIGRATEMGKPILYVLGLGTASDIATIASYTILGRVAKKVAEYQTGLIVPCNDPIVMTVAQETVKTAYLDAGRPDSYNDDIVFFVTSMQFPYVTAVNGLMLRQLPATNIYMGKFYAESLLLAETGALAKSIQISGTDEIAQIPFFVVACDYTLIGEELYAASAYLGREPILLGSLKAQDYAKIVVIILAVIGFVAANFGWNGFARLFHVAN